MSDLENLYNKRFKDKELSNDDFDVDGLWDAVSADLDQTKDDKPKASYFRKFGLLAIALLLTFGIFYLGINHNSKMAELETIEEKNSIDPKENNAENKSLKSNATFGLNEISETEQKVANSTITNTTKNIENGNNSNTATQTPANISTNHSEIALAKTTHSTARTEEQTSANIKAEQTTPIQKSTIVPLEKKVTEKNNRSENKSELQIAINNSTSVSKNDKSLEENIPQKNNNTITTPDPLTEEATDVVEKEEGEREVVPATQENISQEKTTEWASLEMESADFKFQQHSKNESGRSVKPLKNRQLKYDVLIFGGINNLNSNFKTPTVDATFSASEKGDVGFSLGIKAGMLWKERWSVSTGFEYHQLWSKFEYEGTSTREVMKENVLVQVVTDPSTKTTVNRHFADTLVQATDTRSVVHNNKYTLYSIPLELGWQNTEGRFMYGVSAGLSLNFVQAQEGKRLDDNGVLSLIAEDTNTNAFEDFGLGFRISPMVGFRLNKTIILQVSSAFEWSGLGMEIQNSNGVGRLQMNVGLGFRF